MLILVFLLLITYGAFQESAVRNAQAGPTPAAPGGIMEGAVLGIPALNASIQGGSSNPTARAALYVHSLDEPAMEMPLEMAHQAGEVWLGCEVRGWWERWPTLAEVTGLAGERGQAQLHPIHAQAMARRGLDYGSEADRVRYSIALWEQQGWGPWKGCQP